MDTDDKIIIERLKFYADTDKEKNKYFCFKISSILDLENRLLYWMKKVYIRSAWYECIEDGEVVSNDRIDIVNFYDTHVITFAKK